MKKILIPVFALAFLAACNSDDKKPASTPTAESSPSDNPDYKAGLALVSASDCVTCHRVDERLTGPSYKEISAKYSSQAPGIIPTLAEKVIKGGSGNWGTIPMQAHPGITEADAETMVKYILTFKN